jgi:hypothetical protein
MKLNKCLQFILAIFLTTFSLMAFASDYQSYFDSNNFGDCIVTKISKVGGVAYFNKRKKIANDFAESMLNGSVTLKNMMANLNFIERRISMAQVTASLPIIDFSSSIALNLQKGFPLEQPLFEAYKESQAGAPIERADLLQKVVQYQNSVAQFDATKYLVSDDIYINTQQKTASMANPLVLWLLGQPKHSVSHWALLNFATNVYGGDILTALGVIGEMFYQETLNVSDRNRQAVLASKMIPLLQPATSNPVGDNYHFWQIITASYFRGGTVLGRIYSPFDSTNPGHRLSNKLGLDIASRTFSRVKEAGVSCALK